MVIAETPKHFLTSRPSYKAPPVAPPPIPTWMYGLNLVGSGDWSRSGGVRTNSYGVTGSVDITKIGIFPQYDALTFIFTGSGIWTNAINLGSDTGVGVYGCLHEWRLLG